MSDSRTLSKFRTRSFGDLVLGSVIPGVLVFVGACSSGGSASSDVSLPESPPETSEFLKGADLSYLNSVLGHGAQFADASGKSVDPYAFFAQRGADLVRMRLWHTPANVADSCGNPIETNNLNDVVTAFERASQQGMGLLLSIHYGDYFNDPARQLMPAAWQSLNHQELVTAISDYTTSVLTRLRDEGVVPEIVVIGNETTWGFVDATEPTDGWSWPEDAEKFNAALNAVDQFAADNSLSIRTALHVTEDTALWMSQEYQDNGVTNFDILGISYYPQISGLASLDELGALVSGLASDSDKDVLVLETAVNWTTGFADSYANRANGFGNLSYAVSPEGQRDYLIDLSATLERAGGIGVIYWEPAWVTSGMCDAWGQGSSHEHSTFFDFNTGNSALPAFEFFIDDSS